MPKVLALVLLVVMLFAATGPALAASFEADIASSYPIADSQAVSGDILIATNQGISRASTEYDQRLFGVLTDKAIMVFRSADPNNKPVSRSGIAVVNVTNANGPISKGDYITSSATPGKGEKATISGYVVGQALEDMTGSSGQISVAVRVEYAEISNARTLSRLVDYVTADVFRNVKDQGQLSMVLRYIIAGLIMLTSIAISFVTFSRSVPKAIEAIGRNPLARTSIMISLSMSIGLVIATIGLGLAASIVILRI
ncbi:hypothetical protein M1403_03350 [Patescibacteria group bacterium]|nr:hypothetical protein [Patescibacteria group bacterium]